MYRPCVEGACRGAPGDGGNAQDDQIAQGRTGQLFDKTPHQDTPYPVRGHGQETEEPAWYRRQIIKPIVPSEPEKAQIDIEGADDLYREIRIENTLTDEHGEDGPPSQNPWPNLP
jgi:hypothetical protein